MYDIKKKIKNFKLDAEDEVEEMEEIINNPLCTILNKTIMTLEETEFDKGKPCFKRQTPVCVLEWDEKVMLV